MNALPHDQPENRVRVALDLFDGNARVAIERPEKQQVSCASGSVERFILANSHRPTAENH